MKAVRLRQLSTLGRGGVRGQQDWAGRRVWFINRSASSAAVKQERCNVVVVGGGIMGLSSAYFIKRMDPSARVCVLERDPQYKMASTALSVSSIRQQFSLKENIQLSMWSSNFLQNVSQYLTVPGEDEVDIQFFQGGYLFLASERGKAILEENYALQRSEGAAVEWLDQQQLRTKYPWLNVEGLTAGVLGVRNEGWFDSWTLLFAFKRKALSLGVQYVEGTATGLQVTDDRVESVQVVRKDGEEVVLPCSHLINAAGPWAGQVARLAGIGDPSHLNPTMRVPLPVVPRKRMVFVFHCPEGPADPVPLTVDPTGVYFRLERSGKDGMYICGRSPAVGQDKDGEALEVDYDFFEEHLWPALAQRVPAFEGLKIKSAWAGYYDYNTFDQNGIIGSHPVLRNFVLINGFSGHGIQQAPAAGHAVAEIVTEGGSQERGSVDVRNLGFGRIVRQEPLLEKNIV